MLGYRMFFTVPDAGPSEVTTLAMEQLHAWLRDKNYAADALTEGKATSLAKGVEGLVLKRHEQDGSVATRARIIEETGHERWTSELTVHIPGSHGRIPSVWLDINDPSSMEEAGLSARWTATPRLARRLLGVMPAFDRSAQLTDRPIPVMGSEAEALVDVICDPDRRGLVFVAGSDEGMPLQPWIDLVARLLRDTIGLAAAYVLDWKATETLTRLLGDSHAVSPGTVRTFLPGADPASDLDAMRHRVLTAERIVRGDGARVARLLGWKAREVTLESPLPNAAARVARAFENQLNASLTDLLIVAEPSALPVSAEDAEEIAEAASASRAVTDEAEPAGISAQAAQYLALRELTSTALGIEDVSAPALAEIARLVQLGRQATTTQAAVSERLNDLQDRLSKAEDARQELVKRLEDEQLEHAETAQRGYEADRLVNYLRRQLIDADRGAAAWAPVPADGGKRPGSFDDLLEIIAGLERVSFTGDPNITAVLDDYDPIGTWAGKAWDALAALNDYARATYEGLCERDVDGYLRNTPEGFRSFSANRHARDESQDVQNNSRFRSARVFPVPSEIDPSGRAFMGAHFKIAQFGLISPRLHYLDDTARTGRIYVGYIGRHLPTKKTN